MSNTVEYTSETQAEPGCWVADVFLCLHLWLVHPVSSCWALVHLMEVILQDSVQTPAFRYLVSTSVFYYLPISKCK